MDERKSAPDLPAAQDAQPSASLPSSTWSPEMRHIKLTAVKPRLDTLWSATRNRERWDIYLSFQEKLWRTCNDVKVLSGDSQADVLLAVYSISSGRT